MDSRFVRLLALPKWTLDLFTNWQFSYNKLIKTPKWTPDLFASWHCLSGLWICSPIGNPRQQTNDTSNKIACRICNNYLEIISSHNKLTKTPKWTSDLFTSWYCLSGLWICSPIGYSKQKQPTKTPKWTPDLFASWHFLSELWICSPIGNFHKISLLRRLSGLQICLPLGIA